MNKPFSIAYEEFKQELANLINNSGLPAFVIETILQSYLLEIRDVVQKQYQMDKVRYEQALLEEKVGTDNN